VGFGLGDLSDDHPDGSRLAQLTVVVAAVSLVLPLVVTATIVASVALAGESGGLPTPRPSVASEISHVYDADGNQIATFHRYETSLTVAPADIPQAMRDAVVAIEDRRFWSHRGVDIRAALRAAWHDLAGGGFSQGGSTITEQYVKQTYTGSERSLRRKLREAVLAARLEHKLPKAEILYRYLSQVYLGSGIYGVGAAAESYFHKPVRDVDLSEAALLAGVISSPSLNEPRANPGGAEVRRQEVLRDMLEQRRIDARQYDDAVAQHVVVATATSTPEGAAVTPVAPSPPATVVYAATGEQPRWPYFVDYVRRYLLARYGPDRVYRGGLEVHTSLDSRLQAQAEAVVTGALAGTQPPLESALVSLDPSTGLVKALVGGRDFAQSQVNLALGDCAHAVPSGSDGPQCVGSGGTGRQPGSAFKPFTLAKAFEKGFTPARVYPGPSYYTFPHCRGQGCTVHNVESGGYGSVTLRQATVHSINTVFAQLILDVGIKDTAELAHRLGLTMVDPGGRLPTGEPYGPSLTLGAAEVSPLDMAAAYSVFAARGVQHPATPVARVTAFGGKVLEDESARSGRRVLTQSVADTVTNVLEGVIGEGTGRAADIGRPNGSAGKTGTAENFSDAWFIGYTPTLSTAVWMGFSNGHDALVGIKGVRAVYGGTLPAQMWKEFMAKALEGASPADFAGPPEPPVTAPPRPRPPSHVSATTTPAPAATALAPVEPPTFEAPPVTLSPPLTFPVPSSVVPADQYSPPTPSP
jgi:penicillin-binding protein 1A